MYYENEDIKTRLLQNFWSEYESICSEIDSYQLELEFIFSNCEYGELPKEIDELGEWIDTELSCYFLYDAIMRMVQYDSEKLVERYMDEITEMTYDGWSPFHSKCNGTVVVNLEDIRSAFENMLEEHEETDKVKWNSDLSDVDIIMGINTEYSLKFLLND